MNDSQGILSTSMLNELENSNYATAQQKTIAGTQEILEELKNVLLTDKSEMEMHLETGRIFSEIADVQTQAEDTVKDQIKGLCNLKDEAEESIKDGASSEEQCRQEEDRLAHDIDTSTQHKAHIEQQVKQATQQKQAYHKEKEQLTEQRRQIKKKTTEALPHVRYAVNLYHSITRIKWQYDTEAHEVKGYMSNQNEVRPFSLSSKDNTQFFIANYLWDQMEVTW